MSSDYEHAIRTNITFHTEFCCSIFLSRQKSISLKSGEITLCCEVVSTMMRRAVTSVFLHDHWSLEKCYLPRQYENMSLWRGFLTPHWFPMNSIQFSFIKVDPMKRWLQSLWMKSSMRFPKTIGPTLYQWPVCVMSLHEQIMQSHQIMSRLNWMWLITTCPKKHVLKNKCHALFISTHSSVCWYVSFISSVVNKLTLL